MPGVEESRPNGAVMAIVQRVVLVILVLAMAGTFLELLLAEHFEDVWQLIPVVLLGLGFCVIAWHAIAPSRSSAGTLRALMMLFVLSGLLGVFFHYRGNAEFEIEQNPRATGWTVFREAMMGGVPALAPGVMIQIGLLGLLYAFIGKMAKTSDVRIQNSELRGRSSEF